MTISDDVLKLNPELAGRRRVEYQIKPERLLLDDGFDSDLERDFDTELRARGYEVRPHGWMFHLPGGVDYTPDFIAWPTDVRLLDGVRVYEVKGSAKQKNARDSRTRFKIAAGLYPLFLFIWVTRRRDGSWLETEQVSTETSIPKRK